MAEDDDQEFPPIDGQHRVGSLLTPLLNLFRSDRSDQGKRNILEIDRIQIAHDSVGPTQHCIRLQYLYVDGTTETVKTDFFTDLEEMIGFLETFKAKNFNPPNQEIWLKEAKVREDIDRILRDARLTHALNRKE